MVKGSNFATALLKVSVCTKIKILLLWVDCDVNVTPGDVALQQCLLGMEFSGRDQGGKRVMGLVAAKGLATSVDADKRFVWDVPANW